MMAAYARPCACSMYSSWRPQVLKRAMLPGEKMPLRCPAKLVTPATERRVGEWGMRTGEMTRGDCGQPDSI